MWIDLHDGPLVAEIPPDDARHDQRLLVLAMSPTSALSAPTRARAASTCCCRPDTRARCRGLPRRADAHVRVDSSSGATFPVNGDIKPAIESLRRPRASTPCRRRPIHRPTRSSMCPTGRFSTVAPADYTLLGISQRRRSEANPSSRSIRSRSASLPRSASRRASRSRRMIA